MRPTQISQLKAGDRVRIINDFDLQLYFTPTVLIFLKDKIKYGDFIGIREQDSSELFGTIITSPYGPEVKFDLGQRHKLDLQTDAFIGLLEPGDDGYNPPNSPKTPPTQRDKGAVVDMRPFNRDIDGVGTRVAVNSEEVFAWAGDKIFVLGTVERLDDDKNSKVNYDGHKPEFTKEEYYIVFGTDEDVKKVRTFDNDKDGEGSRVAVLGTKMPIRNDVTKMYYGTIKSSSDFSSIKIEFDTDVIVDIYRGVPSEGRQLFFRTQDLIIIDGSATKNVDNSFFLKSIAEVLLSTTSKTNLNRIEVVESALAENFGADGKEAIEYALESKESFNLFKEILEGLGQMEARRLGVSVKPKIETLTPAPAVPKAPRKKKEPVLPEPVEIITPDTSVFQNENELSSILDEFLT